MITREGADAVQIARGAGGLHESCGERVVEEAAEMALLVGAGGSDQHRRTGDTDRGALQDTLQIAIPYSLTVTNRTLDRVNRYARERPLKE
ncbi:hypothetical protein GCM10011609_19670 [Lentzea pudingi]|uniref:Uncharacterized protein n=1 Tax=Lentzea pudingi TaxID=1789439 RepID=A0ABQ2HJL1_9PSEU|nr:hypothetical protein GCM10011609_19670 [Lentzea pudingi]